MTDDKLYDVTDLGPGDGGKGGIVHSLATMLRPRTVDIKAIILYSFFIRLMLIFTLYMSTYTIPQDVETEDKIIGPFGIRQFIYLLICAALGAMAFGLWQLTPVLAILPVPPILFFLLIALPLGKAQPMEVYVSALIRFYLFPQKHIWVADGEESFVDIIEDVNINKPPVKEFGSEEAEKRISFLSDIIETHGWKTREQSGGSAVNDEIQREVADISDVYATQNNIDDQLAGSVNDYKNALFNQMQQNTSELNNKRGA